MYSKNFHDIHPGCNDYRGASKGGDGCLNNEILFAAYFENRDLDLL